MLGEDTEKTRDEIHVHDFEGEQIIVVDEIKKTEDEDTLQRSVVALPSPTLSSKQILDSMLAEGVNCLTI